MYQSDICDNNIGNVLDTVNWMPILANNVNFIIIICWKMNLQPRTLAVFFVFVC